MPDTHQTFEFQQLQLAGRNFSNQKELLSFIQTEVVGTLASHSDSSELEILNPQHLELLLTLFKYSSDHFNPNGIVKVVYGPHAPAGGSYDTFKVCRFVMEDPSSSRDSLQNDKIPSSQFAVPYRRQMVAETVSVTDSVNKMYAEVLFCREQGFIRSVNGVFFPKYYAAVQRFVQRYPLLQHEFLEQLIKSFPHHRSEKLLLVCATRNLLSLAVLCPEFEARIIDCVISVMVKLDCEIKAGSNKEKMDQIIELLILYINFKLEVTEKHIATVAIRRPDIPPLEGVALLREKQRSASSRPRQADKEEFIHMMLKMFSEKVIKVEKPFALHFVYYYLSALAGEFDWVKQAFLQQLIINLADKHLQRHIKLHSLYYLFSFLRSSTFLTGLILHTSLSHLIQFLASNYGKYLRRNPQISIRKMSSEEIHKTQARRTASTENTSPVGDDIFIFCYQSCLDLLVTKKALMSREQVTDLVRQLDLLTDKTQDFVAYSMAESETFAQLFQRLRDHLEDSRTKKLLELLAGPSSAAPVTPHRFISPKNKSTTASIKKNGIRLRDIDYIPFRPLRMNFFEKFISAHLIPHLYSESYEPLGSPFDSSLSHIETTATEHLGPPPFSPLGKRLAAGPEDPLFSDQAKKLCT